MDYRIVKKDAFKIVCRRKKVTKPQGDTATADISAFWGECSADGSIPALCSYIPEKPTLDGLLGVCFSGDMVNLKLHAAAILVTALGEELGANLGIGVFERLGHLAPALKDRVGVGGNLDNLESPVGHRRSVILRADSVREARLVHISGKTNS